MDEARRFLRLVTPGLVFAVEVVILLWLLRPDLVSLEFEKFKTDSGISFLFAGLLASGGLGFIFSAIHHNWHGRNWTRFWKPTKMDHSGVIKQLIDAEILKVCDVSKEQISRENAWIIMNAIWHQRVEKNYSKGSDGENDGSCRSCTFTGDCPRSKPLRADFRLHRYGND